MEAAITFGGINDQNIEQLRLLNNVIFPVKYNDKFYAEILTTLPEFTKYGEFQETTRGPSTLSLFGVRGMHTRGPQWSL
jgi:N-alpha-acetyltransferase 50